MGAAEGAVDTMFEGLVAVFVEQGVQPRRLQVWKEKLQQRGGVIREHIKSIVTHIFALDVKSLEDRVGQGNMRKLRALLLKYEWLEDCLKAGHTVATDPYILQTESKTQSTNQSLPSSDPSLVEVSDRAESRKRGGQIELGESPEKHQKVEDWMSIIHKGAKAGVVGRKGTNASNGDGAIIADSDSADPTSQEPSQSERTYSPPNKNENITNIFAELKTIYGDALGDDRRAFSYHKAISVLEKLPNEIQSVDDVKRLPSIGKSLQDHIREILSTGTLAKLEHFKQDEKVRAITQLSSVWGIGPISARKLYAKGLRTLDDLRNEESLSSSQRIGLKFHSDINKKIPRHEAQEMEALVRKVAESMVKDVVLVCGGSYRRGKVMVGDMDMIFTHPDGKSHIGFLRKLLPKLKEIDFLAEDLLLGIDHNPQDAENAVDTYFGLCKYPGREQRHRIDFKVYPYWKYPYGLIAWTGNDVLNRRLRLLASSKGYRMDDHGCFPVMKNADGASVANKSWSVPCKTEREVFDFLGFPWLEPHERNL
ncbi:unnamed protein product [Calypogeia fissa]